MKKILKVKIFFVLIVIGVGVSMLAYAFTGPTAAPPSGEGYFWRLNGSNLYYPVSGSGNIGVGTSTPYHKIDAVGDVSASGYVRGTTGLCLAGDCRTSWPTGGTSGGWTDGGTAVYLTTATDNVGVGTTNPLAKLYVYGATDRQIAAEQWIDLSSNPSGYGLVSGNAYTKRGDSTFRYSNSHASIGAVGFATNYPSWNKASIFANAGPSTAESTFTPNTVATFESSGEVGIGTATPSYKLHVSGGDAYVSGYVYGNTGLCLAGDCRTSWPGGVGGSGANNYLAKWNGTADITDSLIYDDGTNIGINTIPDSGRKLHVVADTGGIAVLGYSSSGNGVYGQTTSGNGVFGYGTTGTGVSGQSSSGVATLGYSASGRGVQGDSDTGYDFYGNGPKSYFTKVGIGTEPTSYSLQLGSDSAAKPGTNTWTISSDERIKKDIRPFTDGLSVIKEINPVWYKYNGKAGFVEDNKDNIGVIAQDIQKVAPYTVTSYKAKLDSNDTQDTNLLNFNSHALTFVLINSIKELNTRLDYLESENSILKNKIKVLEEKNN